MLIFTTFTKNSVLYILVILGLFNFLNGFLLPIDINRIHNLNETLNTTKFMSCGNARACGVLTLTSGYGPDAYHHDTPEIHGLWPQVNPYGNSNCCNPLGNPSESINSVMKCYSDSSFATHEWSKHGYCAVSSASAYFEQACSLASSPLSIMTKLKQQSVSVGDMAVELQNHGFYVWDINTNYQEIELAVCSGSDQVWKFSGPHLFGTKCGY